MSDPQGALPDPPEPAPADPEPDSYSADPRAARRSRIVILVSVGVLALAGLALAFIVGSRLQPVPPPAVPVATSPSPTRTMTPTPTPTPTVAPVPTGPVAPGTYEWNELGGGECLDPFVSPWEREFSVVDCAQPHPAQLVARGVFEGDAAAPYPGEQELTAELNLLCTRPEVLDRAAAEQYGDLQWQAAYPAGEEQWREGDRSWFCFVSRSSGEPLIGSVAAPR